MATANAVRAVRAHTCDGEAASSSSRAVVLQSTREVDEGPHCAPFLLEERFVPSALFCVDTFAKSSLEHLAYAEAEGDRELLSAAPPFSFDDLLGERPAVVGSNHPLASVKTQPAGVTFDGQSWKFGLRVNVVRSAPRALAGQPIVLPVGTMLLRVAFFGGKRKLREYEVHSGQALDVLLDHFTCVTTAQLEYQADELIRRGSSAEELPLPSDSAAFCIEGRWFVHGPEDLSRNVREWHAERSGAPLAQPVPMGAATFGSLSLRLGQQYLFVHHGDCEHSIVFTRCALAVESDPRDSRQYPRLVWETHGQVTTHGVTRGLRGPALLCHVCNRDVAVWECHSDRLADSDPCLLCENCHYQAHYTKEGEARRTDYKVYPYFGSSAEARGRKTVALPALEHADPQQQPQKKRMLASHKRSPKALMPAPQIQLHSLTPRPSPVKSKVVLASRTPPVLGTPPVLATPVGGGAVGGDERPTGTGETGTGAASSTRPGGGAAAAAGSDEDEDEDEDAELYRREARPGERSYWGRGPDNPFQLSSEADSEDYDEEDGEGGI